MLTALLIWPLNNKNKLSSLEAAMCTKMERSGDAHAKKYNYLRVVGRGCNKHCNCKWCVDNRTHKNKRQMPVDDYGKVIYNYD